MTPRQATILQTAVREHIRTGEPIGSETLVARGRLPLSSATVRAEFTALEEDGYLTQPHASAGRVPTTAGYRHYVDACMERARRAQADAARAAFETLGDIGGASEYVLVREVAHTLAKLAGTLSVVAAPDTTMHEAGFRSLFQAPELRNDPEGGGDVDRLIEVVEERAVELSALAEDGPRVFIDGENPFVRTHRFSMMFAAPRLPTGAHVIAALIGPVRMPYQRHLHLLEALRWTLRPEDAEQSLAG